MKALHPRAIVYKTPYPFMPWVVETLTFTSGLRFRSFMSWQDAVLFLRGQGW